MLIPISILYYVYLIGIGIFLIFLIFNVAHLIRYGLFTLVNLLAVSFIIIFSVLVIFVSWQYVNSIDWSQGFSFNLYSIDSIFSYD